MGDHARGDCKKVTCSSEEEEVYQNCSFYFPTGAVQMMSRLNLRDKRYPVPGTSGESPPLPAPPPADDTDRQFWAEDELSSSESRHRLMSRRKRRHSLAYRNRAAIRRRSGSLLCQSSSSSSDPIHLKIPPPARRRRRCYQGQGPSATKKSRGGSKAPPIGTSTPRPPSTQKTIARSGTGNNYHSGVQNVTPRRQTQASCVPSVRRSGRRRGQTPTTLNRNCGTPPASESQNANKNRIPKPRLPSKSKRK